MAAFNEDRFCGTRRLVLIIIAVAILLDNMLLTTVVPIIPSYLYSLRHPGTSTQPQVVPTIPATPPTFNGDGALLLPLLPTRDPWASWQVPGPTLRPEPPQITPLRGRNHSRHQDLVEETTEVGLMFASKPVVQALANPFVGRLCSQVGYTIPMFSGFIILFVSTLLFAIGGSYPVLFLARTVQGVGSSLTSVSGMGMIANMYPKDPERGNAMSFALGGLALGVLIGPPFGGTLYQFVGKSAPFLILALLALIEGALQLVVLRPTVQKEKLEAASMWTLLKDPYIIVAASAIAVTNLGIAVLEPSLPLWMMDTMEADKWQQGAVFLPASISYLVGTNIFGPLGHRLGRWLSAMIGLGVVATSLLCIPLASRPAHLIVPNAAIGFAIGMVDSSMMPLLGNLVDLRYTSSYGNVYAIGDVAFCVSFVLGPLLSSVLMKPLGFSGLLYVVAAMCYASAPLMLILKNPTSRHETQFILGLPRAPSAEYHLAKEEDDEIEATQE